MNESNKDTPSCSRKKDEEADQMKGNEGTVEVTVKTETVSTSAPITTVAKKDPNTISLHRERKMSATQAAQLILIHNPSLVKVASKDESIVMPKPFRILSNRPSPRSLILQNETSPESLFVLAFSKLNVSTLSLPLPVNCIKNRVEPKSQGTGGSDSLKVPELATPESVISAPPSYSFVLRQIARRRPRLMGTFIPSPSFVLHAPPPNYGAAFDVYIDNRLSHQPHRIYNFGCVPMVAVCHECGHSGLTVISSRVTVCTHLSAIFLCLTCCWLCVPLPYVLRSCKDVYHYCSNCRTFLGLYCRTGSRHVRH